MSSVSGLVPFVHAIPFALAHYAALIGLAALSFSVGRKITTNFEYYSTWERAAVCTSLGLGVISYLIFALCLAHWLYPSTLLGSLGVAAMVCASELRSLARGLTASLRRKPGLLLAGGVILFLPYALLGLYPPQAETSFDALMYHLVVAKLYVQHHGFVFAPYVHFSLFPQLTELLFTLMLTLFDDIAAQMVSSLVLAVLLVAVFAWGDRLFSRTVGYWASAILLGIPMVIWLGTTAYVDITLTLFGTMALYSCWNWLHGRAQQWLILAAIFAGFASATKYSGLFFIGLIALIILFYGVRNRQYAAALLFIAIGVASAAPWYVRTVYYTGNPVFPFLSTIFGHGYWSPEEAATAANDTRAAGVGRSVSAFVSLPWQLAFHPTAFRAYAGMAPRKFFLLMPMAVPFAFTNRRIAFLCAVAFSYIIFWFFASQDMRFLVPAFPLISLSMAAALNSILEWHPLGRRWARNGIVVGIICAAWTYVSWVTAVTYLRYYGPLPVTQEQRDAYLPRFLSPAYPAVKFLNSLNRGRHYTVFPIGGETLTMAYYTNGTFIGESFGVAHSAGVFVDLGDNKGFYRALRSLGADYVLLVRGRQTLHEDTLFQSHFKLIFACAPVENAGALCKAEAEDLHTNSGLRAAPAGVAVYRVIPAAEISIAPVPSSRTAYLLHSPNGHLSTYLILSP